MRKAHKQFYIEMSKNNMRRYEIKMLLAAAVTYHGHPLVEVMAEVKLCGCTNEGIVRRLRGESNGRKLLLTLFLFEYVLERN